MSISKLKTKFFTGAFIIDIKHYFTKINEIIDYLNGIGKSGSGTYKEYTVLLSQSSTNAPTVKILRNTLGGNVIWSYNSIGTYTATLYNNHNKDKQFLLFGIGDDNIGGAFFVSRISGLDNQLSFSFSSQSTGLTSNDLLYNTTFEYRIYN